MRRLIIISAVIGGFFVWYSYKHPCIEIHIEQQRQMPISVVVGGGKYGGGVGIPIGNAKLVDVKVCDKRK